MNVGQIKTNAIMRINEYSNKGIVIGTGQNADYLLRMNGLINEAQMQIARIRKIEVNVNLEDPEPIGDYLRFPLPMDFMEFKEIQMDGEIYPYCRVEGNRIKLPQEVKNRALELFYYRYPNEITADTPEETELEVDRDAQAIIPYFVGAYVMLGENDSIAIQLLNEYNAKLEMLRFNKKNNLRKIRDVR